MYNCWIPSNRDEGSVDSRPSTALHQLQFPLYPDDCAVSVLLHGLGAHVARGLLLDFLGLHEALGPLGTCQPRQTRWRSLGPAVPSHPSNVLLIAVRTAFVWSQLTLRTKDAHLAFPFSWRKDLGRWKGHKCRSVTIDSDIGNIFKHKTFSSNEIHCFRKHFCPQGRKYTGLCWFILMSSLFRNYRRRLRHFHRRILIWIL